MGTGVPSAQSAGCGSVARDQVAVWASPAEGRCSSAAGWGRAAGRRLTHPARLRTQKALRSPLWPVWWSYTSVTGL